MYVSQRFYLNWNYQRVVGGVGSIPKNWQLKQEVYPYGCVLERDKLPAESTPGHGTYSITMWGHAQGGGGVLRYKRDRGEGGGVRRIFLGLKFSTPVFFCVEDLTVYFLGLKNLRVFFWV